MPVVKRIRNRGATVTVEASAEVMFAPGGQVHGWTNRFTGRLRASTIAAAPVNKRPRWGHYGKPLKGTIVSARPRFWSNGRDKTRVYAAVGAAAPHGYYVDQGTGVYAGNAPYPAKILPPWSRGSASLYEHTWRPGPPNSSIVGKRRVAPVLIKGQRGQFFFDAGLRRAFASMRMRSFQIPSEPSLGNVLDSLASGLPGFKGNTPADAGFIMSLEEWRSWRDEAWNRGEGLGRGGGIGSRHQARFRRTAAFHRHAAHTRRRSDAFLATKDAAEARRHREAERLRRAAEAKALGKQRKAEQDAQIKARQAKNVAAKSFEKARLKAYQYMHAIEGAYPDAAVQISKDQSMIRVHYTGPDGPVNEYFLR